MGWIKKTRDTGWCDITSLVPVATTSGRLLIRRAGSQVWLDFDLLLPADPPTGSAHSWGGGTIPAGFRTHRNYAFLSLAPQFNHAVDSRVTSTLHALGPARVATNGSLAVYGGVNASGSVRPIQGLVSWPTSEPFPTALPGVSI